MHGSGGRGSVRDGGRRPAISAEICVCGGGNRVPENCAPEGPKGQGNVRQRFDREIIPSLEVCDNDTENSIILTDTKPLPPHSFQPRRYRLLHVPLHVMRMELAGCHAMSLPSILLGI